jgi:transcriptional regulator with GAF, ATPase, and Fis domain
MSGFGTKRVQIGDTTPRKSNFRLIAATNRDLKPKVKNTVSVLICILIEYFRIKIPPLRERIKILLR